LPVNKTFFPGQHKDFTKITLNCQEFLFLWKKRIFAFNIRKLWYRFSQELYEENFCYIFASNAIEIDFTKDE